MAHISTDSGIAKPDASAPARVTTPVDLVDNSVEKNLLDSSIDPQNEVTGTKLLLIHTGICLCTFLVGLDFNIIATAVPVITSRFDSLNHVGWYGSAFYMTLCASQPLAGKTYTLFPKKLNYLIYLAIFEIGSLVCGLAPSSRSLIAGRAVAGFGASGVFAGGFVLLTTIIPLHKRAIYTGTMSSTFAIASIVGPVLGGGLTQHATWRWCFFINLPIGGFAALIFFLVFNVKPAETENASLTDKLRGLDGIGFALFAAAITMLLLAIQWGGVEHPWKSSTIIGLFIGFGLVLILFIGWQIYMQDNALIPPQLFDNRNVWLICTSSFFVNGPFQIIVYWLPIWFQVVQGVSPTRSGIHYLPTVISDVLASFIGAGIVMQLGVWNPFLLFAEAMVCIGAGLLTSIYPGISQAKWIGYQIFGGIGYSLASNLAHLGMQASLPKDLVPLGATNLLTIMSTSCAIFLGIGQAVFEDRLNYHLSRAVDTEIAQKIISVGATRVREVIGTADLAVILGTYSRAITQVFYIPAAAPVISFALVALCRWTSVKKAEMKEDGRSIENGAEAKTGA
ncbi:MFS general substrate transporter [Periconia macrospinosa]|uniref:MFS general substrate transporter n=1 Tax=Periconia macrospinosa TaxID=97972 RepID=A0A2V1DGZ3_9PLEO|nr:MFS general substrate transporter [Periconia macrospinosa]